MLDSCGALHSSAGTEPAMEFCNYLINKHQCIETNSYNINTAQHKHMFYFFIVISCPVLMSENKTRTDIQRAVINYHSGRGCKIMLAKYNGIIFRTYIT